MAVQQHQGARCAEIAQRKHIAAIVGAGVALGARGSAAQDLRKLLKKTAETNIWGTHAHGKDTMKLVEVEAVLTKLERVFA